MISQNLLAGKNRKKKNFFKMSSAEIFTQHAKPRLIIEYTVWCLWVSVGGDLGNK